MKFADTLPKLWPSFALPGCRRHRGMATYSAFSYEDLPAVAQDAEEQFQWLKDEPEKEGWSLRDESGEVEQKLQAVERELAEAAGIKLPSPFTTFLRSPSLQARIRSSTACYLEMPDYPVPVAGPESGFLVHFLSDQQWCQHWSLYLNQAGEECVICSVEAFGFEDEDEEKYTQSNLLDLIGPNICFCAPSFSEFMYRFWIENEIAFSTFKEARLTALTARQQAYIAQYGR